MIDTVATCDALQAKVSALAQVLSDVETGARGLVGVPVSTLTDAMTAAQNGVLQLRTTPLTPDNEDAWRGLAESVDGNVSSALQLAGKYTPSAVISRAETALADEGAAVVNAAEKGVALGGGLLVLLVAAVIAVKVL